MKDIINSNDLKLVKFNEKILNSEFDWKRELQ